MGLGDKLKGLFGGGSKPAKASALKNTPKNRTYVPPSNRAELIAEVMAVHQRERAKAQGVLEQALKDLTAKPPKPSDQEGIMRLLSLRQAVLRMKATATSASARTQVLAGVKGLMQDGPASKPPVTSKKH